MLINDVLNDMNLQLFNFNESMDTFQKAINALDEIGEKGDLQEDYDSMLTSAKEELKAFENSDEEDLRDRLTYVNMLEQLEHQRVGASYSEISRINTVIDAVKSGYTLTRLFERMPNISANRINQTFISMKKTAEKKITDNQDYYFYSVWRLEKHIERLLSDENKPKAKIVAGKIYFFITNNNLNADGEFADGLFVSFLLRNIVSAHNDKYGIRDELILNLNRFAREV